MNRSYIVLMMVIAFTAMASGLATVSSGGINFAIDTAVFDIGAETLLLEIYQELELSELSYNADGECLFTTEVYLTDVAGDTLAVDMWNTPVTYSESGRAVNCTLFPVTEAEWTLTVRITDANSGQLGEAVKEFSVEAPMYFSDVEIARAIMPVVEGSINSLAKGNVVVFPAASTSFIVPGENMLYLYQELYALAGTDVDRHTRLLDAEGVPIYARPATHLSIPQGMNTVALLDSVDLSVVRDPGLYNLNIVYTQGGDTLGITNKPLIVEVFVQQAQDVQTAESYDTRRFIEFPLMLNDIDKEMFNRLDEEGKILFYDNFWNFHPGQHEGYIARTQVVASRYSTHGKEGYKTDRGRVYLIFGEPDEIEQNPFSTTHSPYESWLYYSNQQENFVFADLMGNGDFLQLYSTVEGEVSYSNWQSMILNVNSELGTSSSEDEDF